MGENSFGTSKTHQKSLDSVPASKEADGLKLEGIPAFNRERFLQRFNEFSRIGQDQSGAINRPFGSEAEKEARGWITAMAQEAGFTVTVDAIGNMWGGLAGQHEWPAIAIGSHHDSVPDGGRFDGPLGVLMGIEVLQSLREAGYENRHPFTFVSFTAEEPNPFELSTMGSRTISGRLSQEKLLAAKDWQGRPLADAVAEVGGNLQQVPQARKTAEDIAAFIELHIEQGRRLEKRGIPIGVVSGICGIYRELITVTGEANHAGTTEFPDRRDALLATSEMLLALEQKIGSLNNSSLAATVGRLNVVPNAMNIIPGSCSWSLELRSGDMDAVYALRDDLLPSFEAIASRRQVSISREVLLNQQPEPMHEQVISTLQTMADELEIPYAPLASMAGHDATHVASFTKAGMLFVPSIHGKSHCKEEESRMEDIERAFYVLAAAVRHLDTALAGGRKLQ